MIFVNSMSDLFHKDVPTEFIDNVYYHEDATADVASMDSTAVYGNLADAMKDSIVLLPDTWIAEPAVMAPSLDNDDVEPGLYEVSS